MNWIVAIGGPLGVIFTNLVVWLVAVRKSSGRIQTTEAATLWDEAAKIRETYRQEVERQDKEIERQDQEIKSLRDREAQCKDEVSELRQRVVELEKETKRLRKLFPTSKIKKKAVSKKRAK